MRYYILAILLLNLVSVPAMAQTDSWENLHQLQPGHKIKVVDVKFKSWSGKPVSVSDEGVTIREDRKHQEITVERANVLRVTDLQSSKRGRNAAIGFVIGAVVGGTRGTEGNAYRAVLAAAFGGMGAGVGVLVPSHPTLYRAHQRQTNPGMGQPGE